MFFSYGSAVLGGRNRMAEILERLIKANPGNAFLSVDRNPPPLFL